MNAMILPGVNIAMMALFILILIDTLCMKFLQRLVGRLLPEKKMPKMNRRKLNKLRRTYKKHERDIKEAASAVIEARLTQGSYRFYNMKVNEEKYVNIVRQSITEIIASNQQQKS